MSYFEGSEIKATADRVARRAGVTIVLGAVEAGFHGLEELIIWTQPRRRRCAYVSTVRGAGIANEDGLGLDDQRGDAVLDRWEYIQVVLRAQGGKSAVTRLSNRFLNALDRELGAHDSREATGTWRLVGDSDGGGEDPEEGVPEEHMTIALRYHVIREEFEASAGLQVLTPGAIDATGALIVNGPTDAAPEEEVL